MNLKIIFILFIFFYNILIEGFILNQKMRLYTNKSNNRLLLLHGNGGGNNIINNGSNGGNNDDNNNFNIFISLFLLNLCMIKTSYTNQDLFDLLLYNSR